MSHSAESLNTISSDLQQELVANRDLYSLRVVWARRHLLSGYVILQVLMTALFTDKLDCVVCMSIPARKFTTSLSFLSRIYDCALRALSRLFKIPLATHFCII